MNQQLIDALTPLEILILTVVGEARGEPIEGQVAVACVCRNRLHANPGRYHNYKDVCLEPKQFSCWNPDDPNKALLEDLANKMLAGQKPFDPYIQQCALIAEGVSNWIIRDNTNSCLFYTTTKLLESGTVKWASKRSNVHTFGNQTFFNI